MTISKIKNVMQNSILINAARTFSNKTDSPPVNNSSKRSSTSLITSEINKSSNLNIYKNMFEVSTNKTPLSANTEAVEGLTKDGSMLYHALKNAGLKTNDEESAFDKITRFIWGKHSEKYINLVKDKGLFDALSSISKQNINFHLEKIADLEDNVSKEMKTLVNLAAHAIRESDFALVHFTNVSTPIYQAQNIAPHLSLRSLGTRELQEESQPDKSHTQIADFKITASDKFVWASLEAINNTLGGKSKSRFGDNKISINLKPSSVADNNLQDAIFLKNDILEKGQLESDYFNSQEPSKSLIMFPPDAKGSDSFFKINGGVDDLKELLILTFKLQVLSKIADLEDPVNGAPEGKNEVELKWVNDLLKEISSEDMKIRGDAINKYLSFSSKLQIAIPGGLIAPLNEISSNNKN